MEYQTPKVEYLEMLAYEVLCQSKLDGNIEDLDRDDLLDW